MRFSTRYRLVPLALLAASLAPLAASAAKPASSSASSPSPVAGVDFAPYFKGHTAAFVIKDVRRGKTYRLNPERCRKRFSPCSTFKIPNSLIGLDSGVIPSPEFELKWDGKKRPLSAHNQDHTLRTAYRDSAVWYYQELARRVGPERMTKYVNGFDYGNRDLSGGIDQFWLESTLLISPEEQIRFLEKIHARKLPVKAKSLDQLLEIMVQRREGGITFRGKTGTSGDLLKDIATMGWFVGSVEKGDELYLFAANITGGENPSGRTARGLVERLLKDVKLL